MLLGCGCVLLDRIVSISNMLYFCALGIGLICRKAALFGYRLDGCLFKVIFDIAFFGNIKQFHLFCKNNLVGLKSWISCTSGYWKPKSASKREGFFYFAFLKLDA